MVTVLTILITGALCVACFFVGAKVGQTVSKGENIEVNPVKIIDDIKDRKEQREAKREARHEAEELDAILENIKNYNGSSIGQRDVPRR
jgi:hypothetical protein